MQKIQSVGVMIKTHLNKKVSYMQAIMACLDVNISVVLSLSNKDGSGTVKYTFILFLIKNISSMTACNTDF